MASYEGETVRIKVTATDFDGVAITGDGTPPTATVTVYDSTGAVVFTEALTWETTKLYWYFDWPTIVGDAGSYKVRARFIGVSYDTWEYGRLSIKVNPVTL